MTLIEGDNLDSDDERMFEEYKRKRLHEMKKEEKKGRYGSMEPLAREDFVREVTEGSKMDSNEEETEDQGDDDEESSSRLKGTGVVVFLFKDSCVNCIMPKRSPDLS